LVMVIGHWGGKRLHVNIYPRFLKKKKTAPSVSHGKVLVIGREDGKREKASLLGVWGGKGGGNFPRLQKALSPLQGPGAWRC